MNQKEVWKKFITAQAKILEHKSKPIGIDTSKFVQIDGLKFHLSVDQEIFKQVFKKEVEDIFNVSEYKFESGYIQTSLENVANITTDRLENLKGLAEICYIDFNENSVVEGVILAKSNDSKEKLENAIGEIPINYHFRNSGLIFLSIEEWRKTKKIKGLQFAQKIRAIYPYKTIYLVSYFFILHKEH